MTDGPAGIFGLGTETDVPAARIRMPVPIFTVDLTDLQNEGMAGLDRARRTGWRYLVEHPAGLSALDLAEGGDRHPELLGGSDVALNLARSARKAERIANADADYEARILDLNMIGDSVLWLRDQSNTGKDRFISLSRTPKELKPQSLIERLRRQAGRKVMAMASAGRRAGG